MGNLCHANCILTQTPGCKGGGASVGVNAVISALAGDPTSAQNPAAVFGVKDAGLAGGYAFFGAQQFDFGVVWACGAQNGGARWSC